ncbi:MAG: M28 family peptidase [Isosphaeraceae bacterium]|nr:M28 family peptidase [Isosphaeraceae bacterium]
MQGSVRRCRSQVLLVLALCVAPHARPLAAAEHIASPAEARLKADVAFLADDAQEGREPGTKGIEAAADYIARAFEQAGLKPAPGAKGYFQPFSLGGSPSLGYPLNLAFAGPDGSAIKAEKADFSPLAIGTGGSVKGLPIVFAGYGITAKDEGRKLDYDDYAGLEVKGKAVLIIRREPQADKEDSPFDGKRNSNFATFRHKATNAFQHGAAAVLLCNDKAGLKDDKDVVLKIHEAGTDVNSAIPFVMISRALADKLLASAGQPTLETTEKEIDADLKPRSHELKGWTLSADITIDRKSIETKNVVGVLEGEGPHADETVVIGAHYDHLGRGGVFSGSLAFLSSDIHNGADDNASGTAMVLELARRLGRRTDPFPRRVVFIAFSGEERGLLGSQHYVQHPLFPLKDTVMMVNLDMVGRLNDKNELSMIGTGTVGGIEALVEALGPSAGLKIKKTPGLSDGFGGSDHQSFYSKDVPVLFAFTGVHRDYHRPSDDVERINFNGMAKIANYLELILLDIIRRPERPAFVRLTQPPRRGGDPARAGMSVYLGTMPDYGDDSKQGMKLAGVREGSPAEQGGLKGGDIITGFGGKPVATIYDFMESMGRYKPGDKVEIVVKRDGQDKKLQVTLGARPKE